MPVVFDDLKVPGGGRLAVGLCWVGLQPGCPIARPDRECGGLAAALGEVGEWGGYAGLSRHIPTLKTEHRATADAGKRSSCLSALHLVHLVQSIGPSTSEQ
jgi:hypothetical protein